MLLNFASTEKEHWSRMNVGDWLRVPQDIGEFLMRELVNIGHEKLATITQEALEALIDEVANRTNRGAHKKAEFVRAMSSRLTASEDVMKTAFRYTAALSDRLLRGDYVLDTLIVEDVPQPEGVGAKGSLSLKYFMDIVVSVRRFMHTDIGQLLRVHCLGNKDSKESSKGLAPCDALSLQMWLPILRESYRLIGYGDISPQQKIWAIHHCFLVARHVIKIIDSLKEKWTDLK